MKDAKVSFAKIAKQLAVGEGTVRRAYDFGRPQVVQEAVKAGKVLRRGEFCHLGEEKFRKIRKLLAEHKSPKEIAATVECSSATVRSVRKKMKGEGGQTEAA